MPTPVPESRFQDFFDSYRNDMRCCIASISPSDVYAAVEAIWQCYQSGGTIFLVDDNGDASSATHFSCDLSYGTMIEGRPPLRAVPLAPAARSPDDADSPECAYVRQLKIHMREHDLLVLLSCVSPSPALISIARYAAQRGEIVAFLGCCGGELEALARVAVKVSHSNWRYVASTHLLLAHLISQYLRKLMRQ